jgi:YD repeat-containing protein
MNTVNGQDDSLFVKPTGRQQESLEGAFKKAFGFRTLDKLIRALGYVPEDTYGDHTTLGDHIHDLFSRVDSEDRWGELLVEAYRHKPWSRRLRRAVDEVAPGLLPFERPGPGRARASMAVLTLFVPAGLFLLLSLLGPPRNPSGGRIRPPPETGYFREVQWRHGVPEGAFPLSAEQASHRPASVRVTREGGRVVRAEVVNGHGAPPLSPLLRPYLEPAFLAEAWSPTIQPCAWAFTYANGRVDTETATDGAGRFVYRLHYHAPDGADTLAEYRDADGTPLARSTAGACRLRITADGNGYIYQVRYLDRGDRPALSDQYEFGQEFRRDPAGRLQASARLGPQGGPVRYTDDCATREYSYDAEGRCVRAAWFDGRGRVNPKHASPPSEEYEYDRFGNCTAITYRDSAGRPVRSARGFARVEYEYTPSGDMVRETYLDEATPARKVRGADGYAEARHKHDDKGRVVVTTYHDAAGAPALAELGFAGVGYVYDGKGQLQGKRFLAADGRLAATRDGYSQEWYTYDEFGRLLRTEYKIRANALVRHAALRYARLDVSYLRPGRAPGRVNYYPTRFAYLGPDEKPALSANGFAALLREYTADGALEAEEYRDRNDKGIDSVFGYQRAEYRRDTPGLLRPTGAGGSAPFRTVEESFFHADHSPARNDGQYRVKRTEYDAHGARSREVTTGYDGSDGYDRRDQTFDDNERLVTDEYWRGDLRVASNSGGYAIERRMYEEARGLLRMLTIRYFNRLDEPVEATGGVAEKRFEYDPRGYEKDLSLRDARGNVKPRPNKYSWRKQRWDEQGRLLERRYEDAAGKLVRGPDGYERRQCTYLPSSPWGKVEEKTWGEKLPGGVGLVARVFDANRTLWDESYFGRDEARVQVAAGYARWRADYDDRQNWSRLEFLDRNGARTTCTSRQPPAALVRYGGPFPPSVRAYLRGLGDRGAVRLDAIDLDVVHRGFALPDAVLGREYTAMLLGYEIPETSERDSSRYTDRPPEVVAALGQLGPVFGGGGCAEIRLTTSGDGRTTTVQYFNPAWQPTACRHGYRSLRREYGPQSAVVTDLFEGFEEKCGYARLLRRYNARGVIVGEEYQDGGGRPVCCRQGYASARWAYAWPGGFSAEYFDQAGAPVATELVVSRAGGGLEAGDVILAYGGLKVKTAAELVFRLLRGDIEDAYNLGGATLLAKLHERQKPPLLEPSGVEVRVKRRGAVRIVRTRDYLPDTRFEDRRKAAP